jgi:hypothetical protein
VNRLICTLDDAVDHSRLPPPVREPGGPARILFINGAELGFATTARSTEHYAGLHPRIDAVHFSTPMKGLIRLMAARGPKPLVPFLMQNTRNTVGWAVLLGRLLRTRFPLERFDVVHFMTQQRAWPMVRLQGKVKTKFAVNIDATVEAWDSAFEYRRLPGNPDAKVEHVIFRHADLVAAASRWCGDSVERDSGVPRSKMTLHKPCARRRPGLPFRTHDDAALRGTPGGPKIRIAFVGNDWVRKGGEKLLSWHQARWSDRVELHVCSSLAPKDRPAKSVVWYGPTPHEKIITQVLPEADLFVMPTWTDTFLIAAQEAQAAGLPVVTTKQAGIVEVVREGVTGFLCDRRDEAGYIAAIERLLDDAALRARMGRAAREHAEKNLNPDVWHTHMMDQLVNLADGQPIAYAPPGVWLGNDLEPGATAGR